MGYIETWLLIVTLFFPRIGLIIAYLGGQIPYNTVPFVGDVVLAVLLPRLLMSIYAAQNFGTDSGWFWAHLIGFIVAFLFNLGRTMQVVKEGKNPWDVKSYLS